MLNIPIDFCNIRYYEKKDKESKGIEARFIKSDVKRKQHASTKPKSLLTVCRAPKRTSHFSLPIGNLREL